MTTIEEIEKAVSKLPPSELEAFRAWFEEFDSARFDDKLERDIRAGKLDRIADRALDEQRRGRTREL